MLYKYRTLHNFQFVLDIIVNQRLYAATYDSMNDPMEGFYTSNPNVPSDALASLEQMMKSLMICSLTPHKDNPLMWAHYADGARGIAIGVEISGAEDVRNVEYESHSHLIANKSTSIERAKSILTYKAGYWGYEDEVRVFIEDENYINVEVKEVVFGEKVDPDRKSLLKTIIQAVNSNINMIDWSPTMSYVHTEPVYSKEYLEGLGADLG